MYPACPLPSPLVYILHRFFTWVIFTFALFFFSFFFLLLLVLFLFLFPLFFLFSLFFAKVQFLDCCAATVEQWAYRRTWRNGSYSTSLCFSKRRFVAFVASRRRVEKRKGRQGWPPLLPSLARYLNNENPGDTSNDVNAETSFAISSFSLFLKIACSRSRDGGKQ